VPPKEVTSIFFPNGIKKKLIFYDFIAYHKIVLDVNPRGLGANNVVVRRKAPLFHSVWQKQQNNFALKNVLFLRL
jgi:hypothetical protein